VLSKIGFHSKIKNFYHFNKAAEVCYTEHQQRREKADFQLKLLFLEAPINF